MEYLEIDDINTLWREIPAEEVAKVTELIRTVSAMIRLEGKERGVDVDEKCRLDSDYFQVCQAVCLAVVKRYMLETDQGTQMSQASESALGYSVSGTYVLGGGGIKLLKSELKQLGFKRGKLGIISMM